MDNLKLTHIVYNGGRAIEIHKATQSELLRWVRESRTMGDLEARKIEVEPYLDKILKEANKQL